MKPILTLYKDEILVAPCDFACQEDDDPFINSYIWSSALLSYCPNCGKIGIDKSSQYKELYLQNIEIELKEARKHGNILDCYQPQCNSFEEMVSNLKHKDRIETICVKCNGSKQIWDTEVKLMKDCVNCEGIGIAR